MKTTYGKEIETRSLTFSEKRATAANLARMLQDHGKIALNNYDIAEVCILSVDGERLTETNKEKLLVSLHNDEITEIATDVLKKSGFDKKKES